MSAVPIAVVIPLHNAASFIGAALETVAFQATPPSEVIVVDDGSTDDGAAIVSAHAMAGLRLITQTNRGPASARNAGLAAAAAPYVAFLDADDLWCPGHLARLAGLAERFPDAGVLGERFRPVPADATAEDARAIAPGEALPRRADFVAEAAGGRAPFYTSSCMVRREAALAAGGFPEGERHGEDLALWTMLSERHGAAASDSLGALYRRSGGGVSARARTVPDVAMRTLERLAEEAPPERRAVLLRLRGRIAVAYALTLLAAGHRAAARAALAEAGPERSGRYLAASLLAALPAPFARAVFAARAALGGST